MHCCRFPRRKTRGLDWSADMVSLLTSASIHHTWLPNAFAQLGLYRHGQFRRNVTFIVRSEHVPSTSTSLCEASNPETDLTYSSKTIDLDDANSLPWGQQSPHGYSFVSRLPQRYTVDMAQLLQKQRRDFCRTDKKDGYNFLYPFGWQEVIVEGQDKVFKDVIEPLESVSVNLIPTAKQDIRDFGPPQEVAETLIKKVLASPSQKTKLIEATEHEVDGKAYYTIEFIAQAPNYTRHALSAVCIGNGKFYTLTTGANERRWEKMKDRLKTVVDSFQIFNV
ncbi:hypothetical protein DH2020_019541 [Rehmannia glutinosa]|uniref:PsbP C-terminal domain-containing protein n=1 Tax=Rehmannia glutinosa TaxID=99300 RepID=A0ABR0WND5_REHGL